MAQAYFPASAPVTPVATSDIKETVFTAVEKASKEDKQAAYIEQRDATLECLDSTSNILKDVRKFNKDTWIVRYPSFKRPSNASDDGRRPSARRSLTFVDDPSHEIEVDMSNQKRVSMRRSNTLAVVSDEPASDFAEEPSDPAPETEEPEEKEGLIPADFQILRLDLKLGPTGSSITPGGLVSQLEKASIANLIDERIGHSLSHIDKLRDRIEDTSSKVLVTGDLNAGKSTLVNALLARNVMPVDQQPCTTMFCEVRDAAENDGVEEAHVVNDGKTYNRSDESTFTRAELAELEAIVGESDAQHLLKLYLKDTQNAGQSLLNNGIVDISLIDAPGLNRDSLGTTEIFARQEEIDVVVFVVSAENHFTLSAKEFLFNASNEKAYIFVVVNKFDHIRDKAKCRRMVMEQIKQLSPRTYEDAEDLVHFVDSNSALARAAFPDAEPMKSSVPPETFETMESALRNFVLVKRAKSKLLPAVTYLRNILKDIDLLSATNRIFAENEKEDAEQKLSGLRPVLEKLKGERQSLEDELDAEEDETTSRALDRAEAMLQQALERVGQGEIGVDESLVHAASSRQPKTVPTLPSYPGILRIWEYAADVRKALLRSLDLAVALAQDEARDIAAAGVGRVFKLADRHLPEGVERSRRVFVPGAMFSPRNRGGVGRPGQAVVAGGLYGLGIGLAQRPELLEVTFTDIFTLHHHLAKTLGEKTDDEDAASPAWGYVSVALTGVTMLGGKAMGLRGVMESFAQVGDIFGNERTRKWVIPVATVAAAGLGIYLMIEMPKTIPRSVGRQIKASLVQSHSEQYSSALVTPRPGFAKSHADRIAKETRKVLRLAAWDTRERHRGALEDTSREAKAAEGVQARAAKAMTFFDDIDSRTDTVRENLPVSA